MSFVVRERMQQPRLGTRKLQKRLASSGLSIGRDRLFALLRERRMLITRKRAYDKTTNSHHRFVAIPTY